MNDPRHHRSPRWLNARMRVARLTIPQWFALAAAAACGFGLYVACATLPVFTAWATGGLYLRLLVAGSCGGTLAVVFYALADDRREPFVRQAIFYLLRRHRYTQEVSRGHIRCPAPRRPA